MKWSLLIWFTLFESRLAGVFSQRLPVETRICRLASQSLPRAIIEPSPAQTVPQGAAPTSRRASESLFREYHMAHSRCQLTYLDNYFDPYVVESVQ